VLHGLQRDPVQHHLHLLVEGPGEVALHLELHARLGPQRVDVVPECFHQPALFDGGRSQPSHHPAEGLHLSFQAVLRLLEDLVRRCRLAPADPAPGPVQLEAHGGQALDRPIVLTGRHVLKDWATSGGRSIFRPTRPSWSEKMRVPSLRQISRCSSGAARTLRSTKLRISVYRSPRMGTRKSRSFWVRAPRRTASATNWAWYLAARSSWASSLREPSSKMVTPTARNTRRLATA